MNVARSRTVSLLSAGTRICAAGAILCLATAGDAGAQEAARDASDWKERQTLTGDWAGARTRLEEKGITVRSRLSQFVQGINAGEGAPDYAYGGKLDFMVRSDFEKLGFWRGLSLTAKAEYNFGDSMNARGGTMVPVNTALAFPGIEGADALDISSFYFTQTFGTNASLVFGKINMFDAAASKRFAGGSGIDSFWNTTFVAPPSGVVPPYLFGALFSAKTERANYGLWVYDPVDCVNRSCLEAPFAEGVTARGSIEFPVKIFGYDGHQGFIALYSTYGGTDLDSLDGLFLPPVPDPSALAFKSSRYYFAYTFDQYLYRDPSNPSEGVGIFGQFGMSDGNPTRLFWSAHIGIGGVGLVPGRPKDNWGIGYYYDALSDPFKEVFVGRRTVRDEQGVEAFYNFSVTPWLTVGADLQVTEPALSTETAVFTGLRIVTEF